MLKHEDFDAYDRMRTDAEIKLPKKVESVSVAYDGGRLWISVNGVEIYRAYDGTRDCCVTVDNK